MKFLLEAVGTPIVWLGVLIVFIGITITGPEYGYKVADKIRQKD